MGRRQECFGYLNAYIPPLFLEEKHEAHGFPALDRENSQGAVVR